MKANSKNVRTPTLSPEELDRVRRELEAQGLSWSVPEPIAAVVVRILGTRRSA